MTAADRRLRARLIEVEAQVLSEANLARDPLRFPRRYADPADAEIVAVLSAQLAYGRVELFGPVIERILAIFGEWGGPAAYVRAFDDARAAPLAPIVYRWNRGPDFVLLFATLQRVLERHASLGALFPAGRADVSLGAAIDTLTTLAPGHTRGFDTWLAHPRDGSACKRWNMLRRWMVRRSWPDLGLWSHLSPAELVIPLDTHVMRVSRFLGLTARADAGWRTAAEITAALARLDPEDPVRFDFALAHLGISGACTGARDATVCPSCPLDPICLATGSAPPTPGRGGSRTTTGRRGRPGTA